MTLLSSSSAAAPTISLLGTSALLFEAPGEMQLPTQRRIWALSRTAAGWPLVRETVPGMNNLMLVFEQPPADLAPLRDALLRQWEVGASVEIEGRLLELPVVYGGEGGPHLADVVAHTGLGIDEIVQRHAGPVYTVYALGSHPGYCYLGGMDMAIATPRRQVPILNLPGGSVSIGGQQTGVSASAGPSGWTTIGSTPAAFFDAHKTPPVLLQPGDTVRFRVQKVIA